MSRQREIGVAPEAAFEALSDCSRFPAFYERAARWERVDGADLTVGSRHLVFVHAGSVVVRSLVRIESRECPHLLTYANVSGIRQTGRLEVLPCARGSRVRIEVTVALPGGPLGKLAEKYLARILAPRLDAALLGLRRHLEFGDPYA